MMSSILSTLSKYRKDILLTLALIVSLAGILGWTFDISIIKGEIQDLIPISQSGAICLALLSVALEIYLHSKQKYFRYISYCLLLFVLAFSGLVLAKFVIHFSFEPEGIFKITSWIKDSVPKGRMSPVTAFMFIILIFTFLVYALRLGNTIQRINKIITVIISVFSFLLVTAYFYKTPLLYTQNFIPVSFPIALAFLFISLALFDIYNITFFSDKFKQQSFISWRLAKGFLPVVLILVIVHGFIHADILYSTANPAVAATILLVIAIIITILIISNLSKHIGQSIEQMEHEKNKFQKELAKSNERFSLIFYNSHEAIGVIKNGIHLFANPAYHNLFDYSEEELKDKPVSDLIADDERDRILYYISERAKENPAPNNYETVGKRKDGSLFDFEVTISLFPDGDEPATIATVRNITERKAAEKTILQTQIDLTSQNQEYLTLFEEYRTINEELSEKNNELNEANKKLTISDEQYRSLFENMLNGFALCRMIFDHDMQPIDFVYLKVNKAFESLTGLKDVVGKHVTEVIPGIRETDAKLLEIYGRVALGGHPEYLETFVEGLQMWFSFSIFSPESECFVAVFDVITERKMMEESLRESRKQLLDIIDNTPALVYVCDKEGRYILANQSVAKIFGTARENVIGKIRTDFIPLEIAEDHRKNELEVFEKKEAQFFEETNQEADGIHSYFTVKFPLFTPSNQIYSVCGISMDITERKKMEQHRNQLGSILEASLNEIYVFDATTLLFKFVNKGALLNLGYSLEQMSALTPLDLKPDYTPESYKTLIEPLEKGEIPKIVFETRHQRANKTFYPVEVHLQLFSYTGEKIFLAVIQDITDRRIIQDQLIAAKEKAEESDRLKTAFLQNMSHEIRTPMNAIMGFSQLLPDAFDNKPKLELFSNVINQRCLDLLEIINEILDISKIESGQLTLHFDQCNVKDMFNELYDIFVSHRERVNKQEVDLIIASHCSPEQSIIITDGVKLRQILINLINNAFKFINHGKIEVGCKFDHKKDLVFYVSDTGIGIPPDKQDVIFNRFFQLNEKGSLNQGGTGLGLAIVKGLVGVLGGEIWLTSEVGKGTTFYFSIPYQVSKLDLPEKTDLTETDQFYFPNKKVLIVEDDYFNAEFIKEIFENTGFQVLFTAYGIEAIEIAKNQSVDIVLMDIRLPDIEGYEAAQKIKERKPDIKIIAQTAYATQADKDKALKSGCDGYISKPFERDQLFAEISKLLAKS